MKKQIQIGVGDAASTAKGFIDAWKRAERGVETVKLAVFQISKFYKKAACPRG